MIDDITISKSTLLELYEDALSSAEVEKVIEKYLNESRYMAIDYDNDGFWHVYQTDHDENGKRFWGSNKEVYSSVSYAGCIEWALKQSAIVVKSAEAAS